MNFSAWYFLFLPILFVPLFLRARKSSAVIYGNLENLLTLSSGIRAKIRAPLLLFLSILFLAALTFGAAGPFRESVLEQETESRNIVLALDISGSMQERDFSYQGRGINRLDAVKIVVSEFIKARTNDRIGIVVFGTNAFLQSPLTRDHSLVNDLVSQLRIGMAGDGTAIGDGLGLSLKRIHEIPGTSKTVILLTDGVNHNGEVSPLQAATIARDLKIKVHTIGIGSNTPNRKQNNLPFFTLPGSGAAEFDEETLKKIADTTGGVYFNAQSLSDLQKVYHEIDNLETSSADDTPKKLIDDLTIWAAYASLLLYLSLLLVRDGILLKVP